MQSYKKVESRTKEKTCFFYFVLPRRYNFFIRKDGKVTKKTIVEQDFIFFYAEKMQVTFSFSTIIL